MAKKLKSIPVYLPDEKHVKLKSISDAKRQPITRLIENEIDKLIKREYVQLETNLAAINASTNTITGQQNLERK